jgi:hypothetical protein
MPSFTRGKDAQAFITDASGTSREITTYVDNADSNLESEVLDTTCWGGSFKSSVRGFLGWTGTITGKYDQGTAATPDQWFYNLITAASTVSSDLTLYPAGSAATRQFDKGSVFFQNYKKSIPVDNIVTWSVDFQLATGSVHRGTH